MVLLSLLLKSFFLIFICLSNAGQFGQCLPCQNFNENNEFYIAPRQKVKCLYEDENLRHQMLLFGSIITQIYEPSL